MTAQDRYLSINQDIERLAIWSRHFHEDRGRPPRYHIQTFGCQQNDHDSEIAAGILEASGFWAWDLALGADLILFNTCSVRANADDRFFGHVGRLKPLKRDGDFLIGVFGCMMEQEVHRQILRQSHSHVDFILGAGAMELLPGVLNQLLSEEGRGRAIRDLTGLGRDPFAAGLPVKRDKAHRALITIMTGCNNFCSYCIVPYTRGREQSRPYSQILAEAREAVARGAVEIMLLGQNVNSYGNDLREAGKEAPSFAELLAEISQIEDLGLVRYMTSHPKDLSDELIGTLGRYPAIEPHIHLPLQAGSDRILARMNRRYTSARYLDLIRRLRASRPGIRITTDLIVGFPGEEEADFRETLRVMEEARFDAAFTFLYSPREGTPAARQHDQSEKEVIQARFQELVRLQDQLSLQSNRRLLGQEVRVLLDGPSRRSPDIYSGRTPDDRLVNVWAEDLTALQAGQGVFVPVSIEKAGSFSLEGRLISTRMV